MRAGEWMSSSRANEERKKNSGNSTAIWRNEIVGRETRVRRCGKGIASGARRDLHPAWKRMRPGIQVQIVSQHCARELETVVMAKTLLPLLPTREDFEEPDGSTPPSVKFHDQRLIERSPRKKYLYLKYKLIYLSRWYEIDLFACTSNLLFRIIIRWKLLRDSQASMPFSSNPSSIFYPFSLRRITRQISFLLHD